MGVYEQLTAATPDYSTTIFSVAPHGVITVPGKFNQSVFEPDGGDTYTVTLGDAPKFWFNLKWDYLSSTDFETTFDFYFDPLKGFGLARSFPWSHPVENNNYVVKFASEFNFSEFAAGHKTVSLMLRVIGQYES